MFPEIVIVNENIYKPIWRTDFLSKMCVLWVDKPPVHHTDIHSTCQLRSWRQGFVNIGKNGELNPRTYTKSFKRQSHLLISIPTRLLRVFYPVYPVPFLESVPLGHSYIKPWSCISNDSLVLLVVCLNLFWSSPHFLEFWKVALFPSFPATLRNQRRTESLPRDVSSD